MTIQKFASPNDLTVELKKLLASCEDGQPSRTAMADALVELAERVAGEKLVQSSSHYTSMFSQLAEMVDEVEAAAKTAKKAEDLLGKISQAFKADADLKEKDTSGNKLYGLNQHVDGMEKAIREVVSASSELATWYTEFNSLALKAGLK